MKKQSNLGVLRLVFQVAIVVAAAVTGFLHAMEAYRGRPFVNKQIDFVHQSCLLSGMPRLARLDAPGVVHHVIIGGIERRKIFFDTKDRNNMIDRLGDLLPATHTACYAWAFLSNHAHFLLIKGDVLKEFNIEGLSVLLTHVGLYLQFFHVFSGFFILP